MKRAVIKCVVQMVLAVQDRQRPEPKGIPPNSPKKQIQPERLSQFGSVSDKVSTFSSESSAAQEKGFHCLFGNLDKPEETEPKPQTEPKPHFYYERVPGVSAKQPYFLDEEEKGDSVERHNLRVFARQHVERVGLGSGRTGHPHGSRRPHACARRPSGAPEQNCCRLVLAGQHLLKDAGSNALDHPGA